MATEDDVERVSVRTYVPAYQRERWREEAERLDMSQSEFVRTMVQAGRRGFELGDADETAVEGDKADATPGGEGMRTRVLDVLREESNCTWDDLLAGVTDDVETQLEEAVEDLRENDRIDQSPRGEFTLTDEY